MKARAEPYGQPVVHAVQQLRNATLLRSDSSKKELQILNQSWQDKGKDHAPRFMSQISLNQVWQGETRQRGVTHSDNWMLVCIPIFLVSSLMASFVAVCLCSQYLAASPGSARQYLREDAPAERPSIERLIASRSRASYTPPQGPFAAPGPSQYDKWGAQPVDRGSLSMQGPRPSAPLMVGPLGSHLGAPVPPGSCNLPLVPLPPLRKGWVPHKECCFAVFPEILTTSREFANFKVKNLDDSRVPLQATVLYSNQRLTMFAEPDLGSPCATISPPSDPSAGILEVRDADGSHYAMLEAEQTGSSYYLNRSNTNILTIDSSTRSSMSLRIASGGIQVGKVSCRVWERLEGELVEIRLQAGSDAALVVGVVLAVLLLCDEDVEDPRTSKASLVPRSF